MKTAPAKKPTSIDEYIKGCPRDAQAALKQVRLAVREVAPEAVETISYQMPALKLRGRILVYFAAHTHHIGLYPAPVEAFAKEFARYETSKGTVRFPLDKPMPVALIKKVVKYMAKEVEAKTKARR